MSLCHDNSIEKKNDKAQYDIFAQSLSILTLFRKIDALSYIRYLLEFQCKFNFH